MGKGGKKEKGGRREEGERERGEEGRNCACHDKSTSLVHCRLHVIKDGSNGRPISCVGMTGRLEI